jgi:hypothetical protein
MQDHCDRAANTAARSRNDSNLPIPDAHASLPLAHQSDLLNLVTARTPKFT